MTTKQTAPATVEPVAMASPVVAQQKQWVPDVAHAANEWADMAANGIQWVRNIAEGISTPEKALANLLENFAHCMEVSSAVKLVVQPLLAPAPQQPAQPAGVRMLTGKELEGCRDYSGYTHPVELQRKFIEVNGLTVKP